MIRSRLPAVLCLALGLFLAASAGAQVFLSEVLANSRAYRPSDGAASDWLELANDSDAPVDVSGWRLTDDPAKPWRKWRPLPEGSVVPAGGCLVVWCDDRCCVTTNGEVHVELRLSREGESLALARSEHDVVSRLDYPELFPDISYGIPRDPALGNGGDWQAVAELSGFSGTPGVFTCSQYNMTAGLGNIDQVTNLLEHSETWVGPPVVKPYPTVCFREDGSGRQSAVPYPGNAGFQHERDQMAIVADAIVDIPAPGPWTFACCSDDGFRLVLTGRSGVFSMECANSRGYAPTLQTFDIPEAGAYAVRLVYFQGGGGAALDLSVAQGSHTQYNESLFHLLGTEKSGVVHALPRPAAAEAKSEVQRPKSEVQRPKSDVEGQETRDGRQEPTPSPQPLAPAYFRHPTPGFRNGSTTLDGPSPAIHFSVPHGYLDAPVDVALSCADGSERTILYTLDGTRPTPERGTVYTAPLHLEHTTCIRAVAVATNVVRTVESTATYLFLPDILSQGDAPPPGFPANGAVRGHRMHYPMNAAVVNGPDRERLLNGFTNAIATLSIFLDPPDFFDEARGIYVNPGAHGAAWERPVRLEQIDPVHGAENEFQAPAGIRIRGAASRGGGNPKHSFRLFFRDSYGASKLRFPLFGKEGADEFDKVDLRTSQNYSWAQNGGHNDTLVHEVFSRDCQRDLRAPYTRTRFLHVFLNGVYWGLYQTQERAEASYGATYFGGERDDWDALKFPRGAVDGDREAWNAFWKIAVEEGCGPDHPDNYLRLLGRNPDGSRNPDYPVYLNVPSLLSYIVPNHYTLDFDSPVSRFGGWINNLVTLRRRTADSEGFLWFRHDSEHSLGVNGSRPEENSLGWGEEGKFFQQGQFNPCTLHVCLMKDPEYRMDFADYVQRACFGDGPMTTTNCILRFRARMAEIDDAIVCEAARWGQQNQTRETWTNACNRVIDGFISKRLDILLQQYRDKGWFPRTEAPLAERLPDGSLRLSASKPLRYVLDFTDPRVRGGAVAPTAVRVDAPGEDGRYTVTLPETTDLLGLRARAQDPDSGEWSPMAVVP